MVYTPRPPRKRSRRKKEKVEFTTLDWIKLVAFAVLAAILISMFIFLRADIGNVANDYGEQAESLGDGDHNSKGQFTKQYDYKNEVAGKEDGSSGNSNNNFTDIKGDGQLVSDTNKNPQGIPLYDGYTMNIKSYDIDYSKFWDSSYSNDNMHGLGDFKNKTAYNSISYEFANNDPKNNKPEGSKYVRQDPTLKDMGGYWTVDGRLMVALPPGALIKPEIYEPMITTHWANESKYSDNSSWTKGAPALSYVSGIFDNSLIGMYVDCVLEDGTVLALMTTDSKALHKGVYNNSELCLDVQMEGYAHRRAYLSGKISYDGILELCITKDKKPTFKKSDLNLENNKIVGFRVYEGIKHIDVNNIGTYENHFTN